MLRRFHSPSTLAWLAGAALGVACSIPDYGARQTPEGDGEGGESVGGVSGSNGGVTSAGNGAMSGTAGGSTRGGTAGATSEGGSGGDGTGGGGEGGESGSTGGNAGSGTAGQGGGGNGGGAGKGGAGNGGAGNTGGAGSGGAAGKGGAGSGGAAGKGGAGSGGAGNTGGAGSGGGGTGGAGSGNGGSAGAGNGGAGNGGGGSGGGPRCIMPSSSNLVPNAGFNSSAVSHFVSLDPFITLSHSSLDATDCVSSGSLLVTNSHPDGLNSGALYCITTVLPGTTYNVGGSMMEPSGFAQGQVFLHFLFTDGPDCTGSFVGDMAFLQGPSTLDTWMSLRQDGLLAPTGAMSLGVHVRAIKNFPNTLAYRAQFDMLYATPAPGEF